MRFKAGDDEEPCTFLTIEYHSEPADQRDLCTKEKCFQKQLLLEKIIIPYTDAHYRINYQLRRIESRKKSLCNSWLYNLSGQFEYKHYFTL